MTTIEIHINAYTLYGCDIPDMALVRRSWLPELRRFKQLLHASLVREYEDDDILVRVYLRSNQAGTIRDPIVVYGDLGVDILGRAARIADRLVEAWR